MKVKRYQGCDMQEALLKIKAELGEEAVILHSRRLKRDGFLGLFGTRRVEVIAAIEEDGKRNNDGLSEVKNELQQVRRTINELASEVEKPQLDTPSLPGEVRTMVERLVQNGLKQELINEIVRQAIEEFTYRELRDGEKVTRFMQRKLREMMPATRPIQPADGDSPCIVVLVGPTGVGKTTTIAKMAADFSLFQKKDVALFTADTYRIAAVEQLKTYSRIIDIPVEVAFTPDELRTASNKHQDKDIILVDTAGRSQKDRMQLSELRGFVEALEPDLVYLVLAATTKTGDLEEIMNRFSIFNRQRLIITKLDETGSIGPLINILVGSGLEPGYFTTGQNVPEDIEVADPDKLVQLVFEEA